MKRYNAQQIVDEGIYFHLRHLAFTSIEERGRLPGQDGDVYVRLPLILMIPVGLVLSLAFVIFLPAIGFVLLAGAGVRKVRSLAARRTRDPEARAEVREFRPRRGGRAKSFEAPGQRVA